MWFVVRAGHKILETIDNFVKLLIKICIGSFMFIYILTLKIMEALG